MSQTTPSSSTGTMLLTFLAGATIGAVLVALTTPKSGPELREDLTAFGRRAQRKAKGLALEASGAWDDLKGRTVTAADTLERDLVDSVNDLRS